MQLRDELLAMLPKHARKISKRRALKWCRICGGKHTGPCNLVITSHGTRTRPDILEQVEDKYRKQLLTKEKS